MQCEIISCGNVTLLEREGPDGTLPKDFVHQSDFGTQRRRVGRCGFQAILSGNTTSSNTQWSYGKLAPCV